MLRVGSPNFSKGEISEDLLGRVDVSAYQAGLKRARNVIVLKYGGVTKRPGTRLVAEVYDDSKEVRLIPFQFSLTQTYCLEMGQAYMRPAALGGMVIEDKLTVQAVTPGTTTQLRADYHGYSVGDQVYLSGVVGMTELNGKIARVVSVQDANNFTVNVDSTAFSAFTGDTGGTIRTSAPPPPPPPPPVPPPPSPTPPPDVGGGGGYFLDPFCVAADTPILMLNGAQIWAMMIKPGMTLRTQHETTLEWGEYVVEAAEPVWRPVVRAVIDGKVLRGTAGHRVYIDGAWVTLGTIGEPDGEGWVIRLTVRDAHTYISNGILSHNAKPGRG